MAALFDMFGHRTVLNYCPQCMSKGLTPLGLLCTTEDQGSDDSIGYHCGDKSSTGVIISARRGREDARIKQAYQTWMLRATEATCARVSEVSEGASAAM